MRKDCVYMGKCYQHGSAVKLIDDELVCNDGRWEKENIEKVPGVVIAPGKDMSEI